jgi:predicted phage baseplate assembly protein
LRITVTEERGAMPLPEPVLDDLRFQPLVDEARRRIIRYCPEWTEYNLSDPGITLVELFAYMTEALGYRLNQVPQKNYIRFLEMLGLQLQPASSARTELTFRLSVPFPITPGDETVAVVPQGSEVATRPSMEGEEETIFTTDQRLTIVAPALAQLRRQSDFNKNYFPRMGLELFFPFQQPPQMGDTFYFGFDPAADISGHILRLAFECEETQAVGVRRSDPPLVWECSGGDGVWLEIAPSSFPDERDTTGGLNNERGAITFYLPLVARPDQVNGREAYWVRGRLEQRHKEQGMYSQSPRVKDVKAFTLGATTLATHATVIHGEEIGVSNGEPGQSKGLRHSPVLALRDGEFLEVEEIREGSLVFIPWEPVQDFSASDRHDRHFVLEASSGQVSFGPSIQQRDGTVRQYGRIPETGRHLRFSQYRHGGGVSGNVPAGRIQVLRSAIPYIDRVTNLNRAEGGRNAESLDEAQMRARRELRAQMRAVTADDYEGLAKGASRTVARVKCMTPGKGARSLPPGVVELLVVPAAFDALRVGDLSRLYLTPELAREVEAHLDQFRLLTTTLRIREPRYLGIQVVAEIVVSEYAAPDAVRASVIESLNAFIAPLALAGPDVTTPGAAAEGWEGWPFGRDLFISEIYSLMQKVPGVKHVLDVSVFQRQVTPAREGQRQEIAEAPEEERALTPVEARRIPVAEDVLLCSLNHEIRIGTV